MTQPVARVTFPALALKLLKIGATGLMATAVYAVLFVALSPVMPPMGAHVVAYLAAVAVQFLILTYRVFVTKGGAYVHFGRARRYVVQILAVLALSTAAERLIEMPPAMEAIALAVVITGINALMYFVWTFRT